MLLAIGVVIASISALTTFVDTFATESLSNFTINIPPGNTTDNQNRTSMPETEPPQSLTPSEGLTLEGLSPQGGSDLAVACSILPERC